MNPTTKYKKEIKKMFYISIDNDIDNWTIDYYKEYFLSKYFDDYFFRINLKAGILYVVSNSQNFVEISKFKFIGVPINLKMYYYILKLKYNFKKKEKYKKYEGQLTFLNTALSSLTNIYKKEIRKEKLENLK